MANPLEDCFLFGDSGEDGFFGPLDESTDAALCMSEADISDYIRHSRPELFQNLNCLPVKSFEIPFFEARPIIHSRVPQPNTSPQNPVQPIPAAISIDGRASIDGTSTSIGSSHEKLLEIHHKRYIQSRLPSRYRFLLRCVRDYAVSITCACPTCDQANASLDLGDFFLTLSKESHVRSPKFSTCSSTCSSLSCAEYLFKYDPTCLPAMQDDFIGAFCDGTIEMPKRKRDISNLEQDSHRAPQTPEFPFNYPSNSNIAIRLRKERDDEIEEILKADEKLEHAFNEVSGDIAKLPDLTLRRPPNHTNIDDRYKKQSLMRQKHRQNWKQRKLDRDRTACVETEHEEPSPTNTLFEREIICHCRELDDGDGDGFDLIKCVGENCLIGWFHLRCIGVHEVPDEYKFSCQDCAPYANRELREVEEELQSADKHVATDHSTLIGGSESDDLSCSDSSDKLNDSASSSNREKQRAEWAAKEQTIIKGALREISEALNEDVEAIIGDSQDEEEELPDHEEGGLLLERPVRTGFLAINNLNDRRHYEEPQSVTLPIRSHSASPAQLDGHLSSPRKDTSQRYLSSCQTREGQRQKSTASGALTQISLPAGNTPAPFHSLACFIYHSLSGNDPHALSTDEAKVRLVLESELPTDAFL